MSSIETINNNGDLTSTNNSKNSSEFVLKTNSSVVDLNEERRFSFNNSHASEDLIREHHMVSAKSFKQSNKNPTNPSLSQQQPNKNVKIASCLDKWYKELKGNVLVSSIVKKIYAIIVYFLKKLLSFSSPNLKNHVFKFCKINKSN